MVRLLLDSDKEYSPVSAESCEGIDFDRLLPHRSKFCSPIRELIDGDIVPFKPLKFRSNVDTSPLPPQVTPVQPPDTAPDPQGKEVAMVPLQFQPEAKGAMVGVMVGLDVVGARVKGAAVGAGVGFEGQLVMASLNSHSALASDC